MLNIVNIYLCLKDKNNNSFKCKSFENFNKANQYFRENHKINEIEYSTMIPICIFTPFKNFLLQYRLSKIFSKVIIED